MSRFIVTRLLGNPDVAQAFAHPTVPHLYAPGSKETNCLALFLIKEEKLLERTCMNSTSDLDRAYNLHRHRCITLSFIHPN